MSARCESCGQFTVDERHWFWPATAVQDPDEMVTCNRPACIDAGLAYERVGATRPTPSSTTTGDAAEGMG